MRYLPVHFFTSVTARHPINTTYHHDMSDMLYNRPTENQSNFHLRAKSNYRFESLTFITQTKPHNKLPNITLYFTNVFARAGYPFGIFIRSNSNMSGSRHSTIVPALVNHLNPNGQIYSNRRNPSSMIEPELANQARHYCYGQNHTILCGPRNYYTHIQGITQQ